MSSPKWLLPASLSARWVPVASCLSGRLSKISSGCDPSFFQIIASVLGLGVCEILCVPLRVECLFPSALWLSQNKPHLPSKPNVLGAHLPGAGPPGWGAQCGAQTPHSLRRSSVIVIILLIVGHPPRVWVLTILCLCLYYPSCCGSFFISFIVENLFC